MFSAQYQTHFGADSALPATQLLLVESDELIRLLVTLAASPRLRSEHGGPDSPGQETGRLSAAALAASPQATAGAGGGMQLGSGGTPGAACVPSGAQAAGLALRRTATFSNGTPQTLGAAAARVALTRTSTFLRGAPQVLGGADAHVAVSRAAMFPQRAPCVSDGAAACTAGSGARLLAQLALECFSWRSSQPALLALAAWEAGDTATEACFGRQPATEAGCQEQGSGTAATPLGHPTVVSTRCNRDHQGLYPTLPLDPVREQRDPALANSRGQAAGGAQDSEGSRLLRLATGAFTGAALDLPRGRHLLRLAVGYGRECTVELRSATPFHAGDAAEVNLLSARQCAALCYPGLSRSSAHLCFFMPKVLSRCYYLDWHETHKGN